MTEDFPVSSNSVIELLGKNQIAADQLRMASMNLAYNQAIDDAIKLVKGSANNGSGIGGLPTVSEMLSGNKSSLIRKLESLKKKP